MLLIFDSTVYVNFYFLENKLFGSFQSVRDQRLFQREREKKRKESKKYVKSLILDYDFTNIYQIYKYNNVFLIRILKDS